MPQQVAIVGRLGAQEWLDVLMVVFVLVVGEAVVVALIIGVAK
jgi:hypothetical protein